MSCFKNIKCIQCNSEMVEDDTDYNFEGNYDGSEFE